MSSLRMNVDDERWVNHCLSLVIGKQERDVTDWKESALKVALQSIVEVEEPGELPSPPPYIDYWV